MAKEHVKIKRSWKEQIPGIPPGAKAATRYCKVCERFLEDHPEVRTEKWFGIEAAETWQEAGYGLPGQEEHSAHNPERIPTSHDALERLLAQVEWPIQSGIWAHCFLPGAMMHEEAVKHDKYTGKFKSLEEMGIAHHSMLGGAKGAVAPEPLKRDGKAGKAGKVVDLTKSATGLAGKIWSSAKARSK